METTTSAPPPTSSATSASCFGLWHRTTTSARSASSAFDPTASPPSSSARARAFASSTSWTTTGSPIPRASAEAMFPAPMRPSFIAPEAYPARLNVMAAHRAPPGACPTSRLVEEALFDQAGALLRRHLDVARREQEHLVGDPLHPAVERVRQAGGEVDQPLGELGVRALEIE